MAKPKIKPEIAKPAQEIKIQNTKKTTKLTSIIQKREATKRTKK